MKRLLMRLIRGLIVALGLSLPLSAVIYGLQYHRGDIAAFTFAELVIVALILVGIRRLRRARTEASQPYQ